MKKTIIVMPVANEEATMAGLIEEILALPYDNLYLYPVVDDYSKDGTADIIRSYESTGRVKLIYYKESRGVITCYLEGFRRALADGAERIIEMDIEALNELGFTVCKRLIIEIMGKHSNIILIDIESGRIIHSIKRISIDVNRYRQLLPGVQYKYPPAQDRIPFKSITQDTDLPRDAKSILHLLFAFVSHGV